MGKRQGDFIITAAIAFLVASIAALAAGLWFILAAVWKHRIFWRGRKKLQGQSRRRQVVSSAGQPVILTEEFVQVSCQAKSRDIETQMCNAFHPTTLASPDERTADLIYESIQIAKRTKKRNTAEERLALAERLLNELVADHSLWVDEGSTRLRIERVRSSFAERFTPKRPEAKQTPSGAAINLDAFDPLMEAIAKRALELIQANPGMLQTRIYPLFPEYPVEQVRYALYFANELGWIYRKKKGSSYQLYPPGRVIDA